MTENIRKLLILTLVFLGAYFIPFESNYVKAAIMEAFYMLQYYAREHVLTCLIPAFFIAGAIANFVSQGAVLKYFGAQANKLLSYSVASVSGILLAVCSCTILPLFAGIYQRGAGIGPAIAFLYSGPAINILAITLTARVLGFELGLARAIGAIIFAIIIGLIMATIYKKEDQEKTAGSFDMGDQEENRSPYQNILYFVTMVIILLIMTMNEPADADSIWALLFDVRWYVAIGLLIILGIMIVSWFNKQERISWVESTWSFAWQIFPLLFAGVFVAGLLMGRPESDAGLIPAHYIEALVGGNSVQANFIASIIGAFMYFATLTEVPILEGLIGSGMGSGPALSLLLAGPALSLPNMLVIRGVLGTRKTAVFVVLVVVMATISGLIYGNFF
ncbi:permease [Natranaerofaba carboxydovora]|uniref:permease n=1 Tax=Natranaerofaba carboxydovora TaxID=2742683 RepID=UPI001F13477E|nr:permease [Natranaerofaba carboxydovora]UMZ73168.1 putative permease [Natranaerofaba carboxydovora]